jgi:molybdenum cofactor synthesis domain-containing protein
MKPQATATLLIIGNEILSGRTQDTNTAWIATKLGERGIKLIEVRVVPDIESDIIFAVNELRAKATYLFTTGGIGPTHDDITSPTMAKVFGVDWVINPDARQILLEHYKSEAELTPARLRMAHIPVGATLIHNPVSGAPGFRIENVFVMAGVPRIMQGMLDGILPELQTGVPILSNTVTCTLPESKIAEALGDIQKQYESVDIGSYPHFRAGEMGLSLVLRSTDNDNLHLATRDVVDMVRSYGNEPTAISIKTEGKPII